MWVLDVKMGHTLLGVLGLFCEYICDFLCDVQYLYQCSSCVHMTFVADLSWFRLEDYVKYITQLVTFALVFAHIPGQCMYSI